MIRPEISAFCTIREPAAARFRLFADATTQKIQGMTPTTSVLEALSTLPVTLNVDQAFWGQLTPGFWGFTAASSVATFLVGILAYFIAPRYARSSEIALVTSLEILLGPTWVFIGLGEVPSLWTFLGGGLLFVTLCVHELVLGLGTVRFSKCHCAHPRRALAGGDVAVAPMSE